MVSRRAAAVVLVVSGSLACLLLRDGHNWGGDFAAYIMQAHSLVEGTTAAFLDLNTFAARNSDVPMGPDAYPWGYPLILAPLCWLFGFNLWVMKLLNVAFYVAALWILLQLYASRLEATSSTLLMAVFAFNPYMLAFTDDILSDIPFLFLALSSLWLIDAVLLRRRRLLSPLADGMLLGILMFLASLVRNEGYLLLPTLLFAYAARGWMTSPVARVKPGAPAAVDLVPFAVFAVLSVLARWALPHATASNLDLLAATSPERVASNLWYYLTLPAHFFWTGPLRTISFAALP
ncbi:hypothetical protein ACFL59_07420, partial [Planctomycetota bacterium]